MYSGTGVWAGQAHWQSTTLWKYAGAAISVGFKTVPLYERCRFSFRSAARANTTVSLQQLKDFVFNY
jgi:hypothetical protein